VQIDREEHQPAEPTDPRLTELLAASERAASGYPHRLISGAGHDAAVMASLTPMTMLFLRSVGGISHHSDEAVHADDVALALRVMIDFLHRLAAEVS
jgi:allantoate deiminase